MHRGTAGSDLAATQVSSLITHYQEQELSSTTPTVPSVLAQLSKQDMPSDWRGLPGGGLSSLGLLNLSLRRRQVYIGESPLHAAYAERMPDARRTKEIGKSQLVTSGVDTAGTFYLPNPEAA